MNHAYTVIRIEQENGIVAYEIECACGWKTFRRQRTERFAKMRHQEHLNRIEAQAERHAAQS